MPYLSPTSERKKMAWDLRNGELRIMGSGSVLNGASDALHMSSTDSLRCSCTLAMRASRASALHEVQLTRDGGSSDRKLALARSKLWWMSPWWGSSFGAVPPETQLLLIERSPEHVVCILPLISFHCRCTLVGNGASAVHLRFETGNSAVKTASMEHCVCVSSNRNGHSAIASAVATARDLLGTFTLRQEKAAPEHFQRFGWCTWDAFYRDVDYGGLKAGVECLQRGFCPPRFVILDDGWQDTCADWPFRMFTNVRSASDIEHPRSKSDSRRRIGSRGEASRNQGLNRNRISVNNGAILSEEEEEEASQRLINAFYVAETQPNKRPEEGSDWSRRQTKHHHPSGDEHQGIESRCMNRFYWRQIHTIKANSNLYQFFLLLLLLLRPFLHAIFSLYAVQSHRLRSVVENRKLQRLPNVIEEMKASQGIELFYVWHTLLGYWSGIHPHSLPMRKYKGRIRWPRHYRGVLEAEPSMAWDPVTAAGIGLAAKDEVHSFYSDLHGYLSNSGVDGVKVDAQALVSTLGRGWKMSGPCVAQTVHRAMEHSVERNFRTGAACINCMCHANDNFFYFWSTSSARVSDDYLPNDRTRHTAHIVNVSYVSLLLGQIVQPDWDMFQTTADGAWLHAAARAVAGCPLYVSDEPGKHDFEILRSVVLPNGRTLSPRTPAVPTHDCLFTDVTSDRLTLLKVSNSNACTGILGLFNVQGAAWDTERRKFVQHDQRPPVLSAFVTPAQCFVHRMGNGHLLGAQTRQRFAAYSFRSGALAIASSPESVITTVALERGHYEVVTVAPTMRLSERSVEQSEEQISNEGLQSEAELAVLGLENMINCGGAIEEIQIVSDKRTRVQLVAGSCGTLLVYCTSPIAKAYADERQTLVVQSRAEAGFFGITLPEPSAEYANAGSMAEPVLIMLDIA
jgi:raffinose synthase